MEWDTIFTVMCWLGMSMQARLVVPYINAIFSSRYVTDRASWHQFIAVALMFPFFFLQ